MNVASIPTGGPVDLVQWADLLRSPACQIASQMSRTGASGGDSEGKAMTMQLEPQSAYALRTAQERRVRFVRLWFVDVLGGLKGVSMPTSELAAALAGGVTLDGSALEGSTRRHERDVIAMPDAASFQVVPWRHEATVGRMFCDIELPDGRPSPVDSRALLKRTLRQAADMGYGFHIAAELEFFLFGLPDPKYPSAEPLPLDGGSYYDLTPMDVGSDVRGEAIAHLQGMGIPVVASHHEAAPSQHEIDLQESDALSMADAVITSRLAIKEAANAAGLFATFMPKPLTGVAGSGLHLDLSLFCADDVARGEADGNLLEPDDPDALAGLSDIGRAFLAGMIAHAREITAVTNQWTNSYRRLVPGFEAPESVSWTRQGRSTFARIPERRAGGAAGTHIELRLPDAACNPYLSFALILEAGLRGIERDYALPPEDDHGPNVRLPVDLHEALDLFASSELAREVLGERLFDTFEENKREDLRRQREAVTEHERAALLRVL